MKKLYLSNNGVVGGVCSGIGEYFDIDPLIIRSLFILSLFLSGLISSWVYIILWLILPRNPF